MNDEFILLDTHVHTSEVSVCGKVPAAEMVRRYKDAGYDGIIITDHYNEGYFEALGELSWEKKIESFISGYKLAQTEGKNVGLMVFFGIEARFSDSHDDYLVFGLDEKYLIENPKLYEHTYESFKAYIDGTGALIFQAHPYRKGQSPANPSLLHGIEVFNGNPRHDSQNDRAYAYAKNNNLRMIAGSDAHQIEDIAISGIKVPRHIDSIEKLIKWYLNKTQGMEHIYIRDKA